MSKEKPPEWIPSDLNPKRILTIADGRILRRAWYGDYWDEAEGTDLEVYAEALRAGMDRHPDIEANIDMVELRRLLPEYDLD
ncbi:MAG: hypothetical protein WD078_15680 [Woeseia sp.]